MRITFGVNKFNYGVMLLLAKKKLLVVILNRLKIRLVCKNGGNLILVD